MIRRILNVLVSLAIIAASSHVLAQTPQYNKSRGRLALDTPTWEVGPRIGFRRDYIGRPKLMLRLDIDAFPNLGRVPGRTEHPDVFIPHPWNMDNGIFVPRKPQRQPWQDLMPRDNWIDDRLPTEDATPLFDSPLWNGRCCSNCFCGGGSHLRY